MSDLIECLRKRAEIRRGLRKGEPDRIAELLDEAADEIVRLNEDINDLYYAADQE